MSRRTFAGVTSAVRAEPVSGSGDFKIRAKGALFLLQMAAHANSDRSESAELRISDDEATQRSGANLFTVSRMSGKWQRLGYVEKGRRRLSIHDRDALLRVLLATA